MKQYKVFLSYVIPSVLAFALSGIYAIVDGFFVGNSVGDIGLSSINVAYPAVSLIQSLGTGIGMGGAVLYAIRLAMGEAKKAEELMQATLSLLLFSGIAVTIGLLVFLTPLLRLLGAEGELLLQGRAYLRIIVLGAVFQIFGTGLLPLIRNQNGATYAMGTMICGFGINMLLDYCFVWRLEWGIAGAAAATVIGQVVTMIGSLFYLWRRQLPIGRLSIKHGASFFGIARVGLAPFGLNMSPIISLIFINRFSMTYGGETAVACYACVAYMLTILYYFMQGVGDGSQPLMSQYFGEGNWAAVKRIRRYAYVLAELLTVVGCVVLFRFRGALGAVFGASEQVSAQVAEAIPIFLIGVLFLSFARIITSGFYATANGVFSYILVYAEPMLLLLLLLILPRFGGQPYVWWSMAGAQLITCGIAFCLKTYSDRENARKYCIQKGVCNE